jgi:protein gp37
MARNSKIEWTDHTFNPWWGCTKVSAACDNCYAEAWSKRTGHSVWGPRAPRRFLSEGYWRQPLTWNSVAERRGQRARVFCASMADVFEWRTDLRSWRERLWKLIETTPSLDWLLLTKRPHLIGRLVPWSSCWPDNVWIGTTVETQRLAEKRIPKLAILPAKVRFLSAEPLLGPLDLSRWFSQGLIHWVIAGGESGPNARPTNPEWFQKLRNDCSSHSVAFLFKQWGDWAPVNNGGASTPSKVIEYDGCEMARFGKKTSGRVLDGMTWDQLPTLDHPYRRLVAAG